MDANHAAREFERLFRASYLGLHRRDGKRSELSGASRAVLTHLRFTGPLTIGEAAAHLDRAQSAVSEIISGLEAKTLVERRVDERDRRRTLVWLTPAGIDALRIDGSVLSEGLVTAAMERLSDDERAELVEGLRLFVASVEIAASIPPAIHEGRTP